MRTSGSAARLYDVVVIGVGGMGSAVAFHLASRGASVCALEQFQIGHDRGSSHGYTRIIRLSYFEDPSYVPLLRRAFDLWRELEEAAERRLLHVTGALDAGPPGSRVFEGSRRSSVEHGLRHDVLSGDGVNERYPGYRLPPHFQAVFQPDGGFLEPERCIEAHAAMAIRHGAEIVTGRQVQSWRIARGGVEVHTGGDALRARHLVLCGGPWMPRLAPVLSPVLVPERQVVGWFDVPDRAAFSPARFPVFNLETGWGHYYGFPEHAVPGFKIGRYHHRSERADPDALDRAVHPPDESILRDCVREMFPLADGPLLRAGTCLFTNTPDEHFIVDRLPDAPQVLAVSACSGHGFKFCSVLGEVVADLVLSGRTAHDISRFRLDRFPAISNRPRPWAGTRVSRRIREIPTRPGRFTG